MKVKTPRCRYCGQFVSYAQLDAGIAVSQFFHYSVETLDGPDVREDVDVYHVDCKPGRNTRNR